MIAKVVAAGVLIAAAVVLVSLWHFTEQKTSEIKMRRLQVELNNLQGDVTRAKAIEAEIAEVNRYLDSIGSITQGRLAYPRFMLDIISDMPGTIWLGGISTALSGPVLTATFPVNSRSAYDLAYWVNAFETNTAKYSGVTVSAISVSDSESGRTYTTSISVKYRCQ
jgi:hypothetical protein